MMTHPPTLNTHHHMLTTYVSTWIRCTDFDGLMHVSLDTFKIFCVIGSWQYPLSRAVLMNC